MQTNCCDSVKIWVQKNEIRHFITQNKNKYPEVVKLGYTVERQIANYFLAKPEQITLEEATRIARELVTG